MKTLNRALIALGIGVAVWIVLNLAIGIAYLALLIALGGER